MAMIHRSPHPSDELSSVNVDDVAIDITHGALEQLQHEVDPLQESNFYGIDLYQLAVDFVCNQMVAHD